MENGTKIVLGCIGALLIGAYFSPRQDVPNTRVMHSPAQPDEALPSASASSATPRPTTPAAIKGGTTSVIRTAVDERDDPPPLKETALPAAVQASPKPATKPPSPAVLRARREREQRIADGTMPTLDQVSQERKQRIADNRGDKFVMGRKLYAISEAGPEYCPDIETRWGTTSTISEVFGYDPPTEMDELRRMEAEKDRLFRSFRKVGIRSIVCDMLMDTYGPGTRIELFQFE